MVRKDGDRYGAGIASCPGIAGYFRFWSNQAMAFPQASWAASGR